MPTATKKIICPNCQATFSANTRACPICKLETAKMASFAAAKEAAQKRGLKTTKVEGYSVPLWKRPSLIMLLILLLGIGFIIYKYSGIGKPPAWTLYPTSKEAAAHELLADISTGQDAGYDKAYALITARDPNIDDEPGKYRQLFHNLNLYLSGEFGPDWITNTTFEQNKDNPSTLNAHIAMETLHINLSQQTPADKNPDTNPHYGVDNIAEFDVHDAAGMQQMAGIKGFIGGEAGQGAVDNLNSVLGAMGGGGHESPIQMKLRLLPDLRDPRHVNKYEVYQSWPIRKDPVVRHRLQSIVDDGRYPTDIQQVAQEVLNDACTEEELIPAHVQY